MTKTQNLKRWIGGVACMMAMSWSTQASFVPAKDNLQSRFDINAHNAGLKDVLELIAKKAHLSLRLDPEASGSVNFSSVDSTLAEALQSICSKNGLGYKMSNGQLVVYKLAQRNVAAVGDEGLVQVLRLNYAKASDVSAKLADFFGKNIKFSADEATNSILISNEGASLDQIKNFVSKVDVVPKQVLIEAKIVETSNNFVRDIGMSWGNPAITSSSSRINGAIRNPTSSSPNLGLSYTLGWVDQQALDVKLSAAESRGDAKIISRPKIVTADRIPAIIQSGITYHVKTLVREGDSASASSTSNQNSTVSGGLTSVTAGLTLEVKPVIMDTNVIQLHINLTNSEADRGSSVDGIPGIINSSAKTSIMVKEGVTATIAGLVKYRDSLTESGVPFLSWMPLVGWLFKGISKDNQNSELVIFITPKLVSALAENDEPEPEQIKVSMDL